MQGTPIFWTAEQNQRLLDAHAKGGIIAMRVAFPDRKSSALWMHLRRLRMRYGQAVKSLAPKPGKVKPSLADSPHLVQPCADGSRPFGGWRSPNITTSIRYAVPC